MQFDIYVGNPNPNYGPCHFQTKWLLSRQGVLDEGFQKWLARLHKHSLKNKIEFDHILALAIQEHNTSLVESKRAAIANQKTIDLSKQLRKDTSSPSRKSKVIHKGNTLQLLWSDEPRKDDGNRTKAIVLEHITQLILPKQYKTSKACRMLLPFLLSDDDLSLSSVITTRIDSQEVPNFSYLLAVHADTHGKFIHDQGLKGFEDFIRMPLGVQLLAFVELRNILEDWSMSHQISEHWNFDLTEFRNDLRRYFLHQQWKKKRIATAKDMYMFAQNFRFGKNQIKSLLGELAWTLKAAHAGDTIAQCAIGYYFGKCSDGERYLYWTRKSAEGDFPQAIYNLGSSYVNGGDGLRTNLRVGLKYLLRAEQLKHENAMAEIGWTYIQLRDYKNAKRWLEKAVRLEQRDGYAYYYLGELYEKGLGVPKSRPIALGYYMTAGDMGHEYAQKAAQRLRGEPSYSTSS